MKTFNIPFSPPEITEADIEAVADALRSGWITTGPRTKQFEKDLTALTGSAGCVAFNSATAAMEMCLRLLGVGPGDEVIVPAYTYTATASVICHVGATPVMVDTLPDSFEPDYDAIDAAVTPATKVIMPVDIAGRIVDLDRVLAIAESHSEEFVATGELQEAIGRIIVLADDAHALGATNQGRPAGSIADFSAFSFHAVKNLTTAEGGALVWNKRLAPFSDAIYRSLQLLSLHGQSKDALAKTKAGAWEYDIVAPNYKCNMTDIQAALGLSQLSRYQQIMERRKEIVAIYDEVLAPLPLLTLRHYGTDFASSGHLYLTRIKGATPEQRNEVIRRMAERGVATNVHYKPLPLLTAYKSLGYDIESFPNAYAQYANEVTLPLHTCLTDEQARYVAQTYADVLKEVMGC